MKQETFDRTRLVRILIVEDYPLVREGIKVMLNSSKAWHKYIPEEAATGREALDKGIRSDFDIILMDFQMPDMNGADITQALLKVKPNAKILAFSNFEEEAYVQKFMRMGAKGYILKNIESLQLYSAIDAILDHRSYYSNEISSKMQNGAEPSPMDPLLQRHNLTKREIEVITMIANEFTNGEIAEKLFLSPKTVDVHRHNALVKLKARNTAGLLRKAYNLGLINPTDNE